MSEVEPLPAGCRGVPFVVALGVIALAGFVTAWVVPGDPAPARAANEAAAIRTLGAIADGQAKFRVERGRFGTLTELAEAGLIPAVVAARGAEGYAFSLTRADGGWVARAEPAVPGKSGTRRFVRERGGELRAEPVEGK